MDDSAAGQLARAREALARFRYAQALHAAQIALGELEQDNENALSQQAEAHELAGDAALNLREFLTADEHLRTAVDLLDELGEQRRLLACLCALAECASRQGDLRKAKHLAEDVLLRAQQAGWSNLEARALTCLGNIYWQEGSLEAAVDCLNRSIDMFHQLNLPQRSSRSLASLGVVQAVQGNLQAAMETLHKALREFQQQGDLSRVVGCLNNLAGLAYQLGDTNRAREYLLQCVELENDLQDRGDLVLSWHNLGLIELQDGRRQLARKYFHRSFHLAQEVGDRNTEGASLVQLGLVSLLDNEVDEALNYARLSEPLLAGSTSTTAHSLQLHLPLFYLAAGHIEKASELWPHALDSARSAELGSAIQVLGFMLSDAFAPEEALPGEFSTIASRWLDQLNSIIK